LLLPDGAGPFPVVVLAHGCGGRTAVDRTWAIVLRDWGYATFAFDSFTGRNLLEVCGDATVLSGTQRIPDAYGALRRLATHPRIDARRAALMGSHGGILTLNAATVWARRPMRPPASPHSAPFSPSIPTQQRLSRARSRLGARAYPHRRRGLTPAASCVSLAESLKAAGYDVAITVYPGAYHARQSLGRRVHASVGRRQRRAVSSAPASQADPAAGGDQSVSHEGRDDRRRSEGARTGAINCAQLANS
jgi:dienelactone hydrolase